MGLQIEGAQRRVMNLYGSSHQMTPPRLAPQVTKAMAKPRCRRKYVAGMLMQGKNTIWGGLGWIAREVRQLLTQAHPYAVQ